MGFKRWTRRSNTRHKTTLEKVQVWDVRCKWLRIHQMKVKPTRDVRTEKRELWFSYVISTQSAGNYLSFLAILDVWVLHLTPALLCCSLMPMRQIHPKPMVSSVLRSCVPRSVLGIALIYIKLPTGGTFGWFPFISLSYFCHVNGT